MTLNSSTIDGRWHSFSYFGSDLILISFLLHSFLFYFKSTSPTSWSFSWFMRLYFRMVMYRNIHLVHRLTGVHPVFNFFNWQVVAVEPNIESVHRIQKAAQLSSSTEFITLVNNGISDERSSAKIHVRISSLTLTKYWPKDYIPHY